MIILLLFCIGVAYVLQKVIYRTYWNRKLGVQVDFVDNFAYEGDVSSLKEEITNGKKLPLPALEVRLAMNRALRFSGEALDNSNVTDQSYRRDVFSLFMDQKIIRRLTFTCEKRGFYQIQKAELVAYDFFFRGGYYLKIPQNTEFYVYPRPVAVERIKLICQAVSGMVLVQNRLYPDPFEFAGIREYRPTDPMNHINWKASARGGGLMVNQYDSTTNIQVCILLDTRDVGILRYEDLTEEGIRIAASLTARMTQKNMEVQVVSNGICVLPGEITEKLHMHLKPGAGKLQELYRKMACIDISRSTEEMAEVLHEETFEGRTGYIELLISHNQDDRMVQAVKALAAKGNHVLWVLPVSTLAPRSISEIPGVEILSWEVGR